LDAALANSFARIASGDVVATAFAAIVACAEAVDAWVWAIVFCATALLD
jgi:hypothetical protein